MGIRHEARERAVQFLFQTDLNPPADMGPALEQFWDSQRPSMIEQERSALRWKGAIEPPPPTTEDMAIRQFAEPLILGVLDTRDELDALIERFAKNWSLRRMAVVDRNILRLAIFEMLHRHDIPPVVSINEAVDIAKKFSTPDSGRFVNGMLDKIKDDMMRPSRVAL